MKVSEKKKQVDLQCTQSIQVIGKISRLLKKKLIKSGADFRRKNNVAFGKEQLHSKKVTLFGL